METFDDPIEKTPSYHQLRNDIEVLLNTKRAELLRDAEVELRDLLQEEGLVLTENSSVVNNNGVFVHGRVKQPDRIRQKMESTELDDENAVWDILGLEIVVDGDVNLQFVGNIIRYSFLNDPTEEERMISKGKYYRDIAYLFFEMTGYEALFIRKVTNSRTPIEVRVIRKDIWEQTQEPDSPMYHANYVNMRYNSSPTNTQQ